MKFSGKSVLLSYSHAVLFAELFDSELVHGGGHVLDMLLQVLGVTLHQRLGDATPAVLEERREERDIRHDYIERGIHLMHIKKTYMYSMFSKNRTICQKAV